MQRLFSILLLLLAGFAFWQPSLSSHQSLETPGLREAVRILQDPWGVSHIYASNQHDLFFAQGFNAARDRLFQLELWRRAAEGSFAEILGKEALPKDIGSRLMQFRGDLRDEMRHYHPEGDEIITAFVAGVNAYISRINQNPADLPLEFELLGIRPGKWTVATVVSRHNGLFRNVRDEIRLSQLVNLVGAEKVKDLIVFEPKDPDLSVPAGVDLSQIQDSVIQRYTDSRSSVHFRPQQIVNPAFRGATRGSAIGLSSSNLWDFSFRSSLGSNNWVVAPQRTLSGRPYMANDPHRSQQVPSLRYFVHLVAPGWNVIGGGEPALPGVSIGHNQQGAWGLTIFSVDQEDLYVYETDPENPDRYRYAGGWEQMQRREEIFQVKGEAPVHETLRFTRHGPVVSEDPENHRAYAVRAAWLEPGAAPYLASLRFDQAESWEQFREACRYFLAPSENMVWADVEGNIGWQATGITPLRQGWDGLLPVSGDGRYEWAGYLSVHSLPNVSNPQAGFFSSANQNNLPPDFPYRIGFLWSEPFRHSRIQEFFRKRGRASMADMISLQQDYLSLPARALVPLLLNLKSPDPEVAAVQERLRKWDYRLTADSPEAAIYQRWERHLMDRVWKRMVPEAAAEVFHRESVHRMLDWLLAPDARFGVDPLAGRDQVLLLSLQDAVSDLKALFGPDISGWRYGDPRYHHILIEHPVSEALNDSLRRRLNVGPLPRGGNSLTVNATNSSDNQTSGASFRVIVDVGGWDNSLATNSPGQSGNPASPHYKDLFESWAAGRYFPLLYSRERIAAAAQLTIELRP